MRLKTFVVNMKSMSDQGDCFSCGVRYCGGFNNHVGWFVEYSGDKIKDKFGEWYRTFHAETPEELLRLMAGVLDKEEGNFLTFDDSDLL